MQLAMMEAADRDGELVTHAASQCTRLCKREMMRIRWDAAAHKTGLPEHESAVLLIAQPNRFAQSMNHVGAGLLLGPPRNFVGRTRIQHADGQYALVRDGRWPISGQKIVTRAATCGTLRGFFIAEHGEPRLKPLLDNLSIRSCQGVFGRQIPMRPGCRLVSRIYSRQL